MDSVADALQTQLTPHGGSSACLSDLEGPVPEPYGGCDCKYCLSELRRVRDKDGGGIGELQQGRRESVRNFEARNPEIMSEATVKQWDEQIDAYFDKDGVQGEASRRAKYMAKRLVRSDPRSLMEMKRAAAEQLQPELKQGVECIGNETRMSAADQVMVDKVAEECSAHQGAKERHQDDDGSGDDGTSSEYEIEDDQAKRCEVGEADDEVDGNSFLAQLKSLHDNSNDTHTVSSGYHGAQLPPSWYPDRRVSSINSLSFVALQDPAVSEGGEPRRSTSRDMPPPWLPKHRQDSMTDPLVPTERIMNDGGEKKQKGEVKRLAEEQARRQREFEAARAVEETIERNGELVIEGAEDEGGEIVLGPREKWCDKEKKEGSAIEGQSSKRAAVVSHEDGDGDWELL